MGKRHRPEEIIGKLGEAAIVLAQGGTTGDACRRIAVTEQTYYRWRKEYGGLKTDQARLLAMAAWPSVANPFNTLRLSEAAAVYGPPPLLFGQSPVNRAKKTIERRHTRYQTYFRAKKMC